MVQPADEPLWSEHPIDLSQDVVAEFAAALRAQRRDADDPPLRVLARETGYSISALSQASNGRGGLPTWELTKALVEACGGDLGEWRQRWVKAKEIHYLQREEERRRKEQATTPPPPDEDSSEPTPPPYIFNFSPGSSGSADLQDRLIDMALRAGDTEFIKEMADKLRHDQFY